MNYDILIDHIELETTKFDMTEWNCGSAACIGGWLEILVSAGLGISKAEEHSLPTDFLGSYLGLSEDEFKELCFFWSADFPNCLSVITKEMALYHLRMLRDKVYLTPDWRLVFDHFGVDYYKEIK